MAVAPPPVPGSDAAKAVDAWMERLAGSNPDFRRQGRPNASEQRERRWQGATTNRLNQGHWQEATGQPINADAAASIDLLRARSEDEISKNPLAEGMVSTYTLCCLGSNGPTLQIVSDDAEYNAQREAIYNEWSEHAGSNQQLGICDIMRLWVRSLFGSGEYLDQFVSIPDAPGPVKMRLLPVHAHRLFTPPEFLGDHSVAMGVRRDLQNRRPLCYYLSQPYIMGSFEVYTGEFLEVPYRDLLHGFLMMEEDQVRGVPWLAPCLDAIGELRDYVDSTLDAARAAADLGVFFYSNHPDLPALPVGGANQLPPDQPMQRRQRQFLPPGWEPKQVVPQQPPSNWEMFYKSRVQEIGRAVNMPLMMMLLDSSNHNYSSARFDGQLFWRGIGYTQGSLLGRSLDRIEEEVAREAELAYLAGDRRGLKPCPQGVVQRRWLWPRAPHVDPVKERMADRTGLENGDLTYADVCARDNRDWVQVIAERKRINDELKKSGLPSIPGIPDPSKVPGGPGGQDDDTEPTPGGNAPAKRSDDGWGRPATWGSEAREGLIRALQANGNGHNGNGGHHA